MTKHIAELITQKLISRDEHKRMLNLKDLLEQEEKEKESLTAMSNALAVTHMTLDGIPMGGYCSSEELYPALKEQSEAVKSIQLKIAENLKELGKNEYVLQLPIIKSLYKKYGL